MREGGGQNQGVSIDPASLGRLTHLPKDTRDLVFVRNSGRARAKKKEEISDRRF